MDLPSTAPLPLSLRLPSSPGFQPKPVPLSLQSRSAKDSLNVRKLSAAELVALQKRVRTQCPESCTSRVVNEIVTRRNVKQLDILDNFYTRDRVPVSRSASPLPSMTPHPSAKRRKTLSGVPAPSSRSSLARSAAVSGLYPMLAVASEGTFFDRSFSVTDLASPGLDDILGPALGNVPASPAPTVLPSPSGMPMQTFIDSLLDPMA